MDGYDAAVGPVDDEFTEDPAHPSVSPHFRAGAATDTLSALGSDHTTAYHWDMIRISDRRENRTEPGSVRSKRLAGRLLRPPFQPRELWFFLQFVLVCPGAHCRQTLRVGCVRYRRPNTITSVSDSPVTSAWRRAWKCTVSQQHQDPFQYTSRLGQICLHVP